MPKRKPPDTSTLSLWSGPAYDTVIIDDPALIAASPTAPAVPPPDEDVVALTKDRTYALCRSCGHLRHAFRGEIDPAPMRTGAHRHAHAIGHVVECRLRDGWLPVSQEYVDAMERAGAPMVHDQWGTASVETYGQHPLGDYERTAPTKGHPYGLPSIPGLPWGLHWVQRSYVDDLLDNGGLPSTSAGTRGWLSLARGAHEALVRTGAWQCWWLAFVAATMEFGGIAILRRVADAWTWGATKPPKRRDVAVVAAAASRRRFAIERLRAGARVDPCGTWWTSDPIDRELVLAEAIRINEEDFPQAWSRAMVVTKIARQHVLDNTWVPIAWPDWQDSLPTWLRPTWLRSMIDDRSVALTPSVVADHIEGHASFIAAARRLMRDSLPEPYPPRISVREVPWPVIALRPAQARAFLMSPAQVTGDGVP